MSWTPIRCGSMQLMMTNCIGAASGAFGRSRCRGRQKEDSMGLLASGSSIFPFFHLSMYIVCDGEQR